MKRRAKISKCTRYRYALWREWDAGKPQVLFVMLNPSTADHRLDDATIKTCIRFAKRRRFGRLAVVNLFAFRTREPEKLKCAKAPIGRENARWIRRLSTQADLVVAAWGNDGSFRKRDKRVAAMLVEPKCFGLTNRGAPRHPLYLPLNVRLRKFAV